MRVARADARDRIPIPLRDDRYGVRGDRRERVGRRRATACAAFARDATPATRTANGRARRRAFERFRDPELYRFIPTLAPTTVASLEERFRRTALGPDDDGERWWNWTVVVRAGPLAGAAIGTVETTVLPREDRALIAYSFGRDAWGYGYAAEACASAIAYLRDASPVARVAAFIDTRNARSIALVERLGLERKETIENADRFKGLPSHELHYWLALVR